MKLNRPLFNVSPKQLPKQPVQFGYWLDGPDEVKVLTPEEKIDEILKNKDLSDSEKIKQIQAIRDAQKNQNKYSSDYSDSYW